LFTGSLAKSDRLRDGQKISVKPVDCLWELRIIASLRQVRA